MAPARQTPWHCVPMHVPVVHCTGALHAPVASQVSRPFTVHCVALGEHTPWQDAVPDMTHVWPVHTDDVPQVPLELHV